MLGRCLEGLNMLSDDIFNELVEDDEMEFMLLMGCFDILFFDLVVVMFLDIKVGFIVLIGVLNVGKFILIN